MQKIDRNPASAKRARLGHWRTACRERPRRTPEPRRPAGAGALPRQTAAGGSTELPGCGNTAAGIRRARRPGPIRRPLCCERATDPARSWPRGRERENYRNVEQKIKIQRLCTAQPHITSNENTKTRKHENTKTRNTLRENKKLIR